MLAVVFLSQPLTRIQVIAIIAVCGSVLIEFVYQARQRRSTAAAAESAAKTGPTQ